MTSETPLARLKEVFESADAGDETITKADQVITRELYEPWAREIQQIAMDRDLIFRLSYVASEGFTRLEWHKRPEPEPEPEPFEP